VIEIDGDDHRRLFTWTNDRKRDIELFLSGYHVMRFASSTLADNTDRVLNQIRKALELLDTQESDR
jgi:very-short-patch-repair endonuclease